MTDDPRLQAVARAWMQLYHPGKTYQSVPGEAREFYELARAFLGEDADRKEVMPNRGPQPVSEHGDNATAPEDAGADPPWLDEAQRSALWAFHSTYRNESDQWRAVVRAVLRVANAQPTSEAEIDPPRIFEIVCPSCSGRIDAVPGSPGGPWVASARQRVANAQPVSEAEITAAMRQWFFHDSPEALAHNKVWRAEMRAALEAAAKVRAGG